MDRLFLEGVLTGTMTTEDWSRVYNAEVAVEEAQGSITLPMMTCAHTDQDGDHRRHMEEPIEKSMRRRLHGKQPPPPLYHKIQAELDRVRGNNTMMTCIVNTRGRVSSDQRCHRTSRQPDQRRIETMKKRYRSSDFSTKGTPSAEDISAPSPRSVPHGIHDQQPASCQR